MDNSGLAAGEMQDDLARVICYM